MNYFKEIYAYRDMIASLVQRELRGKYKGSVLGFFWTFLNPLLHLLVYTLVFSVILDSGIEKFYIFLFVALVPWLFLVHQLMRALSASCHRRQWSKKFIFPEKFYQYPV